MIFSNEGTIPKFNRMAFDFAKYPDIRMTRVGSCMDWATVPRAFGWLVGDFPEEWGHGMSVFHNPNAVHPIPVEFSEGFSGRHWFEEGRYENLFRDFTPNASITAVYSTDRYLDRLEELNDLLRREAEEKARQFALALHGETEFLAWRDRFVD